MLPEKPIITQFDETIIAPASAPGGAFRGILRLSGPLSVQALRELVEPTFDSGTENRIASASFFPWDRRRPVPVTIFYWPKGHGYTGEESLEIHTVGSPPIIDAIIAAICRNENVRLANPGEFTMRAFLAGRMNLTQSEAILGVIEATTDVALDTALNQLAGGIAKPIKELREQLFDILVRLEAGFDFAEENIEFVSVQEIRSILASALERTESIRHKMMGRRLSEAKPRIVLIGPPNAGKTTMFNRLLGSERGIVSPTPGTTRDYLEADWNVDGIPCVLVDTAGFGLQLQNDIDITEQKLSTPAATADLILYCLEDGTESSKSEADGIPLDTQQILFIRPKGTASLGEIRNEITARLRESFFSFDVVASTALRCRESVERANLALENAQKLIDTAFDESFVASEIRVALNFLGEIVGEIHTDELLDGIFSRFCIGK